MKALKPDYVKRLYTELRMEANLLTEREWQCLRLVYIDDLGELTIDDFGEPEAQVRRVAQRAAFKLHQEAMNLRWRDKMRGSHVETMLNDTMNELRDLNNELENWIQKTESVSATIDDIYRRLRESWRYWLHEERSTIQDHLDEGSDVDMDIHHICKRCASKLGGSVPEQFLQNWTPAICSVCNAWVACTSAQEAGLTRDGSIIDADPVESN